MFTADSESPSERAAASPTPTTSAAYQRSAPRPASSVLGHEAWAASGIPPIGHWRDALQQAFPAILDQGCQVKADLLKAARYRNTLLAFPLAGEFSLSYLQQLG